MKLKDSDMPEEEEWERLFRPTEALHKLGLRPGMVFTDLGCGYGTFSIPAALIVGPEGRVYAVDIDREKLRRVRERAKRASLANVETLVGDMNPSRKSGKQRLPPMESDFVFLANVIHGAEDKVGLLRRAASITGLGGVVAIINWRVARTPRGPPMRMRPKPELVIRLVARAGLSSPAVLNIPPYHYEVVARRGALERAVESELV